VSIVASNDESFRAALIAPSGERSLRQALSLAGSVSLHGLALALLLLAPPFGALGSQGTVQLVPIDVVAATEDRAAPAEPALKRAPPDEAKQQLPSDAEADAKPSPKESPPDEFEIKLQNLAKLSQPDAEQRPERQDAATPNVLATSEDSAPGRLADLKDFIRGQVERHWSLDLATLGKGDFTIPIHIEITSAGVVLKADIVDSAQANDPIYREIAISARNAVLSSSPIALPVGHYQGVMTMVLYLNPRESLR
jgi:hypothetical protein